MTRSRWGFCSLVLTFVLAAAESPRLNVVPGPAPQVQHPGRVVDVLTDTGGADELLADELPPEMPATPEEVGPVPLRSLRTRSAEPVDILDLLDPTDILDSVEATSDKRGRNLQVGITTPGVPGVPGDAGGPQPSPGPGGGFPGGGVPGFDDAQCDTCCTVGICDTVADRAKPECADCAACKDTGIPCPGFVDKGPPPEGFKAPKLNGAHFLASNPSKAVILTFDAPTNEGGDNCMGYCPCSSILDSATVAALQAMTRSSLPLTLTLTLSPTLTLPPMPTPTPNPNPNQGDEAFEPFCQWNGPDALQADVLSTSKIGKGFIARILPTAIHPQDWPSEDWDCDDVKPMVCAKGVARVGNMACDDARTPRREGCAKPRADVIMSPSALTARLPGQTLGHAAQP